MRSPDAESCPDRKKDGIDTYRPGDRVIICNIVPQDRPLIEAQATIIGAVPGWEHFYFVQFEDELLVRIRLVLPETFQKDPDGILDALTAAWRHKYARSGLELYLLDVRHHANDNVEL